jgi:alanine dehydrogenase
MPILLAEEVQKRLPNLCGSPTAILLIVGQAHTVRVECSFGAGAEISDEMFLGQGALGLSRLV